MFDVTATLSRAHSHVCAWVNAMESRYDTEPTHTLEYVVYMEVSRQTGSTHVLWSHISSSRSCPPPHSWPEISPPGNRSRADKKRRNFYFEICGCLQIPHPAVHLSFPPATVTFLGEDLDGVSFLQWQLWAVPGREVVPGSRYTEAPHAPSYKTKSKRMMEIFVLSWNKSHLFFLRNLKKHLFLLLSILSYKLAFSSKLRRNVRNLRIQTFF